MTKFAKARQQLLLNKAVAKNNFHKQKSMFYVKDNKVKILNSENYNNLITLYTWNFIFLPQLFFDIFLSIKFQILFFRLLLLFLFL